MAGDSRMSLLRLQTENQITIIIFDWLWWTTLRRALLITKPPVCFHQGFNSGELVLVTCSYQSAGIKYKLKLLKCVLKMSHIQQFTLYENIFCCTCKYDNNQEIIIQANFWHAYYASRCTSNIVLQESAQYIEKMLNHRRRSEGTCTLKPQCLATVAMIYEANSDGTIFSLEGRTLNQPPPSQLGELNGQWLMPIPMCLLHIQTACLSCRWCHNSHVGLHCACF